MIALNTVKRAKEIFRNSETLKKARKDISGGIASKGKIYCEVLCN